VRAPVDILGYRCLETAFLCYPTCHNNWRQPPFDPSVGNPHTTGRASRQCRPRCASGVSPLLAKDLAAAVLKACAIFEHQISQEAEELQRYPKEEAEELALIYAARGISMDEARDVASHLIANPEKALDTLAREELGRASPISRICAGISGTLPISRSTWSI
jgi:hypothetical protein